MNVSKIVEIFRVTGRVRVETGLRIGGSQEAMEISGLDNPVIKNPANAEPYIPGSSLKGRMRSLAEWYFGEVPHEGEVTKPRVGSETGAVFGLPAVDPKKAKNDTERDAYRSGPTRLIVRDSQLTEGCRRAFRELGRPLTEVKSENSINRFSSMAIPRPMERVLPGIEFDLELVYRVFDTDADGGERDRKLFDRVVLTALALVEADALGGGGSRGNGKVRFLQLKRNGEPLQLPELDYATSPSTAEGAA